MKDEIPLNPDQLKIKTEVHERSLLLSRKYDFPSKCTGHDDIANDDVISFIKKLKKGTSPGADGITPEHMIYAASPELANILADTYTLMISLAIIPDLFQSSIIVPILKKATLDPNIPTNYRPIAISSIHTKLVEYSLMPQDTASENQFGFRKDRGTSCAISLLNDTAAYTKTRGSPLYVCSLDAEKCFDSIWHSGLFYKLINIIPDVQWLFLYNWYNNSYVQVRWDNKLSNSFKITKGMKQGSILSPQMFNKFINDLLTKLKSMDTGVRIYDFHLNMFAYADDLNLVSTTATGLQSLMNICHQFAQTWRMKFNPTKTNIICIGKQPHTTPPVWTLGDSTIHLSKDTNILGVSFNSQLSSMDHTKNRSKKCRQGMFKLASFGMSYPGLNSDVKAFLWNTIGCPILAYGMESIDLSESDIKQLKTLQGNTIKRVMGISKHSHHSNILKALGVPTIDDVIKNNAMRLYSNIFKANTPARDLQSTLLSHFILNGTIIKGTLLDRIVGAGADPLDLITAKSPSTSPVCDTTGEEDGLVESLRFLLLHDDYSKPRSEEHILATMLTKAY